MRGMPFRILVIPGLVEGGYPGVLRPDPFLLDAEREALEDIALADLAAELGMAVPSNEAPTASGEIKKQMSAE